MILWHFTGKVDAGILMGILRLYLALCVVVSHSSSFLPLKIHGGDEAVQIFFMISGFYMSLVAPKYPSVKQFYAARFMRIFFPYWVVMAGVVIISAASGVFTGNWIELAPYLSEPFQKNGIAGVIFTALTNLTIFFQDSALFLKHDIGENLSFTSNFRLSDSPLYVYLLISPAWSISLELFFYLLFPFLNKLRTRYLIIITLISLAARFAAYKFFGLYADPWNYRFFPFEMAFFLTGMIVFRFYSGLREKISPFSLPVNLSFSYILSVLTLLVLFVCLEAANFALARHIGTVPSRFLFYALWAFLIPILFHLFKKSNVDRTIGELSYPVYLVHLILISLVTQVVNFYGWSLSLLGFLSVLITLLSSIVLYFLVLRKFEYSRTEFIKRRGVS